MISEALEVHVEGGRVSHSWCLCVISYGYGGFGGGRDGGGGWLHAGQSQGVGCMSGDAGAFPECDVKPLMTLDHTAVLIGSSGYGRAGICRSF